MSHQASIVAAGTGLAEAVIDGLGFARERGHMAGRVPVAALGRLADVLTDTAGELDCALDGEVDAEGKAFLRLRIAGSLKLRCQRCLGTLPLPLALTGRLRLVPAGMPWPEEDLEDEGSDAVEAAKEMPLLPLIEDEVLLALPVAPRHVQCQPPAALRDEQEPSPFAALAELKKH